jgi:Domain of unknown function (DUF4185)/Secretion system C-terminal sorting domain
MSLMMRKISIIGLIAAFVLTGVGVLHAQNWYVEQAPEWTALFAQTSGWTGADIAFAFPMSGSEVRDGYLTDSTMFTFGDTFIGEIVDNRRQPGTAMVHNTLAIMPPGPPDPETIEFIWGTDDNDNAITMFIPNTPNSQPGDQYWLKDGIMSDGTIYLFTDRVTVAGMLPTLVGSAVIEIPPGSVPPYEDHIQHELPFWLPENDEMWGKSFGGCVMPNTITAGTPYPDGYVYIYGVKAEVNPQNKRVLVSRVPEDEITNLSAWRFWNGSSWVPEFNDVVPVTGRCGMDLSVTPLPDGRFLMIFQLNTVGRAVAARVGDSPVGPWSPYYELYECPQPDSLAGTFVYNAKAYPHLSAPGELLMGYSVNNLDFWAHFDYPDIYRQRFIKLTYNAEALMPAAFAEGKTLTVSPAPIIAPNPFNASAIVNFELFHAGDVNVAVYDITGRLVQRLHSGMLPAGQQTMSLNANRFASGTYFLQVNGADNIPTQRFTVVK